MMTARSTPEPPSFASAGERNDWIRSQRSEGHTCRAIAEAVGVDHFPELVDRLIAPDKSMVHGDVLLDDAPKPEWFTRATWAPVLFDAPYNRDGSEWAGLPRWSWGDDVTRLVAAGAQRCPECAARTQAIECPMLGQVATVEIRWCPHCDWSTQVVS